MKIIAFVGLMLINFITIAKCDYNGNCYTVNYGTNGGAYVHGFNIETGSVWNAQIQNNGNMTGYDSQGNYWQYDKNSGYYYNYGTGQTCVGTGYARQCF